jgi:hypothetical protein
LAAPPGAIGALADVVVRAEGNPAEENAALARRMATHAKQGRNFHSARRFEKCAGDLEQELLVLRDALEKLSPPPPAQE